MSAVKYYMPQALQAEHECAYLIKRLAKEKHDAIPNWEKYTEGLKNEQPGAISLCSQNALSIIYGVPGSGKTTTIKTIVKMFDANGMKGIVASPTGQATKKARSSVQSQTYIDEPECMTTYRALEYNPRIGRFDRNERNTIDADYIIIDEGSFLGITHTRDLLRAIDPKKTRVILSGDDNQLPSVEPGSVFRDTINSGLVGTCNLLTPMRQGKDSGIVYNANQLLKGEKPSSIDPNTGEKFTDWIFAGLEDTSKIKEKLTGWVCDKIPSQYGIDSITGIQVICPGKDGEAGTNSINTWLKDSLNPNPKGAKFRSFNIGDKVINKRTVYSLGITNGDAGIVRDTASSGMVVDFGVGCGIDGKGIVEISGEVADKVYLNYAGTIHGSQGSEYECQITPLYRMHWKLLSRNLWYTAMTRPRKLSLQFGDPSAAMRCVDYSQSIERLTGLQELLLA